MAAQSAKPRFILIDPSLVDVAGHHFEYARGVLDAARDAGFKTVLAANRRMRLPADALCESVEPAFKYGYWPGDVEPNWLRNVRNGFGRRFRPCAGAARPDRPMDGGEALPGRADALRARARTWAIRACDAIRQRQFAKDLNRFMELADLREGDIVFVPTISEAELQGLAAVLRAANWRSKAVWHVLFRRDLVERPPVDGQADGACQSSLAASLEAVGRAADSTALRLRFWTDTDELTAQFRRHTGLTFATLPIPVAGQCRSENPAAAAKAPFTIVYLGDARREKGFQHLPRIVAELAADAHSPAPVRFVIQAHTVQANVELEVADALDELRRRAGPSLTLIERPANSDEYHALLRRADLVLLPYRVDSYGARSSGVFAEALAAAVPVIVPGGTWMSRQLAPSIRAYHDEVRRASTTVATYSQILSNVANSQFWLDVPPAATHCLSRWPSGAGARNGLRFWIEQYDLATRPLNRQEFGDDAEWGDANSILTPIAFTAKKFRFGASGPLAGTFGAVWSAEFLATSASVPSGAVGAVYRDPLEISTCIREILTHRQHYRRSALALAPSWAGYHNPRSLLDRLCAAGPATRSSPSVHCERRLDRQLNPLAGTPT